MASQTFFPSVFGRAFRSRDPFAEVQRFHREVDRTLSNRHTAATRYPALDIYSDDEQTVVVAALPGLEAGDIDISVEKNKVTLQGRGRKELEQGVQYHRRERFGGEFARSFTLPFEVDGDQVEARFSDGLLEVKLPRAAQHKPRKIEIKSK